MKPSETKKTPPGVFSRQITKLLAKVSSFLSAGVGGDDFFLLGLEVHWSLFLNVVVMCFPLFGVDKPRNGSI